MIPGLPSGPRRVGKAPSLTLARAHPLVPVPPLASPRVLKTRQHRIPHHLLRFRSIHRTSPPRTGPRRTRAARKAHVLSRSLARCHDHSSDAINSSQIPPRSSHAVWCANRGPPSQYAFFFDFRYVCFLFYSISLRLRRFLLVSSCMYCINMNIQFFTSTREGPEARNPLSRCAVLDGRAGA